MVSCVRSYRFIEAQSPTATVGSGDVGYFTTSNQAGTDGWGWDAISTGGTFNTYYHTACTGLHTSFKCHDFWWDDWDNGQGWKTSSSDQWISLELPKHTEPRVCWKSRGTGMNNHEHAVSARIAVDGQEVEEDKACYCVALYCHVHISQTEWTGPLFFHRKASAREDPRSYWGYLSLSPDPRSPVSALPAEVGSIVEYEVCVSPVIRSAIGRIDWEAMISARRQTVSITAGMIAGVFVQHTAKEVISDVQFMSALGIVCVDNSRLIEALSGSRDFNF
ncbi:hypothetical protein RhiJN_05805 [Ceratobasidium sp. AG-Ba]|nr:hypothetical protein RhiJN_05805 [Ceratobasidium sp. AG-Ba]